MEASSQREFLATRRRIVLNGEKLSLCSWPLFRYTLGSLVSRAAMINSESDELTHHALLAVYGSFAHSSRLIQAVEAVWLYRETVIHRPQTEIMEFSVAIMAGL
jgi:hypothetical protein